jgi:hypothetical protein
MSRLIVGLAGLAIGMLFLTLIAHCFLEVANCVRAIMGGAA